MYVPSNKFKIYSKKRKELKRKHQSHNHNWSMHYIPLSKMEEADKQNPPKDGKLTINEFDTYRLTHPTTAGCTLFSIA